MGGAGESAYKWSKQAAYDVGDAFKDMGNWMANEDNWENLGKAIVSPVYTPPYNCGGYPKQEKMCLTYKPQPGELIPDNPETGTTTITTKLTQWTSTTNSKTLVFHLKRSTD